MFKCETIRFLLCTCTRRKPDPTPSDRIRSTWATISRRGPERNGTWLRTGRPCKDQPERDAGLGLSGPLPGSGGSSRLSHEQLLPVQGACEMDINTRLPSFSSFPRHHSYITTLIFRCRMIAIHSICLTPQISKDTSARHTIDSFNHFICNPCCCR